MRLRDVHPRNGWRERVEGLGFQFHSAGSEYWTETEFLELSTMEAEEIDAATRELNRLVLAAVEHVVEQDRLGELGIPEVFAPFVSASWRSGEPSLYGRFDLRFDGASPPKMLEFNADTPTSLVEASIVQRDWREVVAPTSGQLNRLEELLVRRWDSVVPEHTRLVHLACVSDSVEDADTIDFLAHTARRAGLDTRLFYMRDIAWREGATAFLGLDDEPIDTLFKLYPWEWLLQEAFAEHLETVSTRFVEPAWKLIPSSKGILPILWELFPGHPNLLPASFNPDALGSERVVKPLFSREGANVTIETPHAVFSEPGEYGAEGRVYQSLALLPRWNDWFVVTGAWVVGDEPAGAGFRMSHGPITTNRSRFLPHLVA